MLVRYYLGSQVSKVSYF